MEIQTKIGSKIGSNIRNDGERKNDKGREREGNADPTPLHSLPLPLQRSKRTDNSNGRNEGRIKRNATADPVWRK